MHLTQIICNLCSLKLQQHDRNPPVLPDLGSESCHKYFNKLLWTLPNIIQTIPKHFQDIKSTITWSVLFDFMALSYNVILIVNPSYGHRHYTKRGFRQIITYYGPISFIRLIEKFEEFFVGNKSGTSI